MASVGTATIDVGGDFSGFTQGIDEAGNGLMSKAGGWGKAIALAVGPALAIGAVVGLAEIGDQFDSAFDKIRVGTGKTGAELEGLEGSFRTVFGQVPASMDTVSTALTGISQRLGLTGKPLEDLTKQFVNLSRITDTDVSTNVEQITRVFGDWGIATEDQAGSVDKLFRATQVSGIGLSELSGQVVQFGAPLRNLGFSFDQSTALLSLFSKTGVNTNTVVAGLKAGVGKLAKAGEDVPTTFRRVVDEITKLGPGTEATGKAIELFGQRAGPDLADAIAGGKFNIDEFVAAIAGGSDTVNAAADDTDDWREKLELLKNKALLALEPIADRVFSTITDVVVGVSNAIEDFSKSDAWEAIKEGFATAFETAGEIAGVVRDAVVSAFGSARDWIVANWPAIRDAVVGVFDAIVGWVEKNWPTISAVFSKVADVVQGYFEWLIDHKAALLSTLVGIAAAIGGPVVAFGALGAALVYAYKNFDGFRAVVDAVVSWITDTAWPALQGFFDQVVAKVGEFVQGWSDRWEDIKTSVMTVLTVLAVAVAVALAPIIFVWTQAHDQIMAVVRAVWGFIGSYIQAALDVVLGIIDVVLGLLSGDWGRAWDGIKQVLQGVWDGIKALIELSLTIIVALLQGALAVLAGLWSVAWDGIKSVLSTAWETIKSTASTGIDAVVSFFTGLPGRAFDALVTLAEKLSSRITEALDAMAAKAEELGAKLVLFFVNLPGRLFDAMAGIAGRFASIGRDVISGIADGIRGAAGLIKDAVLDALGPLGTLIEGVGGVVGDVADWLGLDTGGIVPGAAGTPMPAVVHGSEVVLNPSQQARLVWNMANLKASASYEDDNVASHVDPAETITVTQTFHGVAGSPEELARTTTDELTWQLRTKAA